MVAKKESESESPRSATLKESGKALARATIRSSGGKAEERSGSIQEYFYDSSGSLRSSVHSCEANSGRFFWSFVIKTASSSEQERIAKISEGYPAHYVITIRAALDLTAHLTEQLFSLSQSTLHRRVKNKQLLSSATSERLDRLASVASLANEVFEDQDRALSWLSTPNVALGNQQPIMLCETEIGANQVRRVLHALEWGGVA
ncbi:TPA: type II RES/Xre toxin-antitoxin system antitoxin [Pseudomonas aeruginosa]